MIVVEKLLLAMSVIRSWHLPYARRAMKSDSFGLPQSYATDMDNIAYMSFLITVYAIPIK